MLGIGDIFNGKYLKFGENMYVYFSEENNCRICS